MTKDIQKKIEKLYKKTKKRGVRISFPFNYQSQIQLIKIEDIDEFIEKEGSLAYNDSNDSLIFFKNTGKDIFYFGSTYQASPFSSTCNKIYPFSLFSKL